MNYIAPIIGHAILATTLLVVYWGIKSGWLTPNMAIGVRTKNTLKNNTAWTISHKVMAPYLIAGALISITFSVVLAVMNVTSQPTGVLDFLAVTGFLIVLGLIILGGYFANSRAASYNNSHNSHSK